MQNIYSKAGFTHRPPQTPTHEYQVKAITLKSEYYTCLKILRVEVRIQSIFQGEQAETLPHCHTYNTPPPAIYMLCERTTFPVTLKSDSFPVVLQ